MHFNVTTSYKIWSQFCIKLNENYKQWNCLFFFLTFNTFRVTISMEVCLTLLIKFPVQRIKCSLTFLILLCGSAHREYYAYFSQETKQFCNLCFNVVTDRIHGPVVYLSALTTIDWGVYSGQYTANHLFA